MRLRFLRLLPILFSLNCNCGVISKVVTACPDQVSADVVAIVSTALHGGAGWENILVEAAKTYGCAVRKEVEMQANKPVNPASLSGTGIHTLVSAPAPDDELAKRRAREYLSRH